MAERIIKTKLPPTLIIGLGGTGCDIVSRVDKLSNDEQREFMRFVFFDTDANELRVRKEEAPHVFTVQTSRRMTVGQALRTDREARENSFPTSHQLLKKPLTEGAGQVRAVSKLAFDACLRDGRIAPLHDAIDELQRLNGDTLEQSMRVVIVSTLVGGTGSGILLPVSMYLRNYLENVCQKKPIIRGICVLPDVFFRGGNKTEVEKNNLRANAYAALRELDAFMMKADASQNDGTYDKYWLKMPTPGTVDEYDDYAVNPMDFCFLYDGLNMDGDGLQNFEAYKRHVADCVYASSVSMLNKRLNSSEDNTILARCEEGGRNRYCGVGSSKLVYPFRQVRDYIAMNWMEQAMTEEWLRYDKAYELKIQQQQAGRKKGVMLPPINKREYYCSLVDSDCAEGNYFASAIVDQCNVKDPDGVGYTEGKWISYYRNLLANISDKVNSDDYAKEFIAQINSGMEGIATAKSDHEESDMKRSFGNVATVLRKYFSKTKQRAESIADIVAESLFSNVNFDIGNKNHIEYWLTDEHSFIHPNAARYFLYNLEMMLQESKRRLTSLGEFTSLLPLKIKQKDGTTKEVEIKRPSFTFLEEAIRSFFEKEIFEKPVNDKDADSEAVMVTIEEYVNSLDLKTLFDTSGNQTKNEWEAAVADIENACLQQRMNIKTYYETYLELTIIEKALVYINQLSSHYEYLYQQVDTEIKRLPRRIERIAETYDNNMGEPVIYVCASRKCLEGLLERCPNIVDPVTLTDEFRDSMFKSIYDVLEIDNVEKQHTKINELVSEKILAFWSQQVVMQYGQKVDMDIIDALRTQAEIEESKFDADEQLYYIKGKREEAMKLAAPFIDRPIGVEPYIIEAYSLGAEVSASNDLQKASIIRSVFPGYENDALMDKYQMLFMKALYNIRVSDLPKFAPADDNEVDPHENGSYYKSYWKRINGVIPDDKQTKILTPHLDKRWHYIGVMPDLSEKSELQCLTDAHRALFISIAYGRIEYDRDQYRFRGNNGDFISDSIIVGDGRCNKFSEIYEAMLMSRPLVLNLLDHYKEQVEKEKRASVIGRNDYSSTVLYEQLNNMRLEPYAHKLSFFELPILYKATAGSDVRSDDESIGMLRHMIDFIEEYLTEFYSDTLDRTPYFVKWMHEQTELLYHNLRNEYAGIMARPLSDPLVKRIKEVVKARVKNCESNCQQGDSCIKAFFEACDNDFQEKKVEEVPTVPVVNA